MPVPPPSKRSPAWRRRSDHARLSLSGHRRARQPAGRRVAGRQRRHRPPGPARTRPDAGVADRGRRQNRARGETALAQPDADHPATGHPDRVGPAAGTGPAHYRRRPAAAHRRRDPADPHRADRGAVVGRCAGRSSRQLLGILSRLGPRRRTGRAAGPRAGPSGGLCREPRAQPPDRAVGAVVSDAVGHRQPQHRHHADGLCGARHRQGLHRARRRCRS